MAAEESSVLGGSSSLALSSSSSSSSSSLLLSHDKEEAKVLHTRQSEMNSSADSTRVAFPNLQLFKRKGIFLVFVWSLSSNTVFRFLMNERGKTKLLTTPIISFLLVISLLFYPLLGWLADVHFTRYRVIKWGLRIMWLASVLFCLLSLYNFPTTSESLNIALKYALYISLMIGLGGFQVSVIQFGIDQLVDASSSEISSFFYWYAWVWIFSGILLVPAQNCICKGYFKSLPLLLLPLLLTIAVSLDYIFHSCLVKEPPSSNPLTLIFKVLRYAAKNKYPRLRSAFTYCDDKRFSRIDLGKSKYGGPFTTEEVEDVKTFWRLLGVIGAGSIFFGMLVCTFPVSDKMRHHLLWGNKVMCEESYKNCLEKRLYVNSGDFVLVTLLPVYKFAFHSILRKHFYVSFLKKYVLGITFFLLSLLGYIAIEGTGHHLLQNAHNDNLTCFNGGPSVALPLNQMWVMIPSTLDIIGQFVWLLGATEFICAQSPYSMKGLMFGLAYGCTGLFTILSFILFLPIQYYVIEKFLPPHYGCEMWHLLFIVSFLFITIGIICCVHKSYKNRLRDDDLPNEQMFAIHYYSQGDN